MSSPADRIFPLTGLVEAIFDIHFRAECPFECDMEDGSELTTSPFLFLLS